MTAGGDILFLVHRIPFPPDRGDKIRSYHMLKAFAEMAPLRMNVTKEDVANTAAFLCSDLSRATTGEIVHVDAGYNILGVPETDEE